MSNQSILTVFVPIWIKPSSPVVRAGAPLSIRITLMIPPATDPPSGSVPPAGTQVLLACNPPGSLVGLPSVVVANGTSYDIDVPVHAGSSPVASVTITATAGGQSRTNVDGGHTLQIVP